MVQLFKFLLYYIAGLLYGLLNNKDEVYSVEFAACASVLKHSVHGDANLFSVAEIENFIPAAESEENSPASMALSGYFSAIFCSKIEVIIKAPIL